MLNRPIAALRRLLRFARLAVDLVSGTVDLVNRERAFCCELDARVGIAAWPQ